MVQTKRAEINSDTAVSIAHHHRPGARPQGGFLPSYDPENLGAWDGQLPNPDLVDQLPPAQYPLPEMDNTLLTLTEWVYSLKLPLRAHSLALAIIRRTNWDTGKGCWASVESLAEDARLSLREAARQLRWLADHGVIGRKRRRDASAETWLIVDREGEQISLPNLDTERVRSATGGRSRSAPVGSLTNSSSTNPINQKVPGLIDAKRVDDSEPEDGVTTGVEFFSLEEERTGTGPEDYQAWVDRNLSEVPTDSEIEQLGKHCWPEWKKHWGGGWAAAWPTWTKDAAGRKKFRSDVVAQIQKVGLPQPMAPDPDNDRARDRSAAWLDQRLEEAPKRDAECAGCGKRRQLPPGENHCHSCRTTVEVAA